MDVARTEVKTMRLLFVFAVLLGLASGVFESCSDWLTSDEILTLDSSMTTLEVGGDRNTWWTASLDGCNKANNSRSGLSTLFWRIGDEFSPLISHLLMLSGSARFWTGGLVVNTPWTWTDGRSLYRYMGTGSVSGNLTDVITIRENDAFHCHHSCRDSSGLSMVALQGDQCFCADNANLTSMTEPDFPCTGTYLESCGTQTSVSLYNIELPMELTWKVSEPQALVQGFCAYVTMSMSNGSLDLVPATDCSRNMTYICQFDSPPANSSCQEMFCAVNESASWQGAMADCRDKGGNLAAPNATNMEDFRSALNSSQPHWIGLSRAAELRTINGSREQSVPQADLQVGRPCQILIVASPGALSSSLEPCDSNLNPLYIKATPGVTRMPLPSTTTPTPAPTTTMPTTTTVATTTRLTTMTSTMMTTMRSTPAPQAETTTSSSNTASPVQQPSNQTAVTVGAIIATIIALCIIFFVIAYMKREGKLCFNPLQPGEEKLREDFNPEAQYQAGTNGVRMGEAGFNLEREEGIDLDSPVGPAPVIPEIHVTEASPTGEPTPPPSAPAGAQGESTGAAKPAAEGGSAGDKQGDAGDEAKEDTPTSSSGSTDQPASDEAVGADSGDKGGEESEGVSKGKSEGEGSAGNQSDNADAPEASGEKLTEKTESEEVMKTEL